MNKTLNNLYKNTKIGYFLLHPLKILADKYRYNAKADEKFIRSHFVKRMGYEPNLESPQTFSEKIQWMKLNDKNPLKTRFSDKFCVREHIAKVIGEEYLIPLILESTSPTAVTSSSLPDYPVIVKTNHASGKVFIVKNKQAEDFSAMHKELNSQLKYNFYHSLREWQYKNIKPRVIVEKLLMDENGEIPKDYKIHCFNGQPKYIQVDSDRFSEHKRVIYNLDWQKLDIQLRFPAGEAESAPNCLDEMIKLATKLADNFNYIRVDFYEVNSKVYFGEMTFTPGSGMEPFTPSEYDREWGSLFKLPC